MFPAESAGGPLDPDQLCQAASRRVQVIDQPCLAADGVDLSGQTPWRIITAAHVANVWRNGMRMHAVLSPDAYRPVNARQKCIAIHTVGSPGFSLQG
jgi:hypothetical protein